MAELHRKTWHEQHADSMSTSDRVAVKITDFSGSMPFIYIHLVWWAIWFTINSKLFHLTFDNYPFGLLTMILSLEAILLGAFILIGQNQQAKRDKIQAAHDRETVQAILSEVQVGHKLTEQVKRLNENQNKILRELRGKKK